MAGVAGALALVAGEILVWLPPGELRYAPFDFPFQVQGLALMGVGVAVLATAAWLHRRRGGPSVQEPLTPRRARSGGVQLVLLLVLLVLLGAAVVLPWWQWSAVSPGVGGPGGRQVTFLAGARWLDCDPYSLVSNGVPSIACDGWASLWLYNASAPAGTPCPLCSLYGAVQATTAIALVTGVLAWSAEVVFAQGPSPRSVPRRARDMLLLSIAGITIGTSVLVAILQPSLGAQTPGWESIFPSANLSSPFPSNSFWGAEAPYDVWGAGIGWYSAVAAGALAAGLALRTSIARRHAREANGPDLQSSTVADK